MSAEDRFTAERPWPKRETELTQALQELWDVCEAGYILHRGRYQCGQCQSNLAAAIQDVKHDEGCIQPALDKVAQASAIEVREFAKAILHGSDNHRAWLTEAADNFVNGMPMPEPRS